MPSTSRAKKILLLAGFFSSLAIFSINAAWDQKTTANQPLTPQLWNDLINKVIELNNRLSNFDTTSSISFYALDNAGGTIKTKFKDTGLINIPTSNYMANTSYTNRKFNIGQHSFCFDLGHSTGAENHDCFVFRDNSGNWWIYSLLMGDSTNLACLAGCMK